MFIFSVDNTIDIYIFKYIYICINYNFQKHRKSGNLRIKYIDYLVKYNWIHICVVYIYH